MKADSVIKRNIVYLQQIRDTLEKHRETLSEDNIQKLVRCAEDLKDECDRAVKQSAADQPDADQPDAESSLTENERKVYRLHMNGMINRLIAEETGLTVRTVQRLKASAKKKLGVIE